MFVGCGWGDQSSEDQNNIGVLVDDSLETDFMSVTFEGPIGDSSKNGVNIATEWRAGAGLTGKSSLIFLGIEKIDKEVVSYSIANLARRTVEIQMISGDSLRVTSTPGVDHFKNGSTQVFTIEGPSDFKVSLNFKNQPDRRYIVGEADDRPAIQELFTATEITLNSAFPRKVRMSYNPDPSNQKMGEIKISCENTSIGVDESDCLYKTSGVPDRGWGKTYGKPCPNAD